MARKIKADLPSPQSLNTMRLDELNANIDKYAKRLNQRMAVLRKQKKPPASLFKLEQLAAEWNPKQKRGGVAPVFYRGKAKTRDEGLSRLSLILKGLRFQTSTLTGLREDAETKIATLTKRFFPDVSINIKQFKKMTDTLEKTRGLDFVSSDQIIDLVVQEFEIKKLSSFKDIMQLIDEAGAQGMTVDSYYKQFDPDIKYKYNKKKGLWEEKKRKRKRKLKK